MFLKKKAEVSALVYCFSKSVIPGALTGFSGNYLMIPIRRKHCPQKILYF